MKKDAATNMRKHAAADPAAGDRLPYAAHVNDHTILTRDGDIVQMIALEGYPFETADTDTLNQIASTRDIIFRGIASSQLILYCHVVRRRVVADLALSQPEGLARQIDLQWRAQLSERRLFVNDTVLTLVRRPAKGKVGLLERLSRKMRGMKKPSLEDEVALNRDLRELDAARVNLMAALGRYGPRQLGQYQSQNGELRCAMMEHLSSLYNGESQPVLVPQGDLGQYIPYKRVSFGIDTLELRGVVPGGNRLGAIISVKDYPAATVPGMLDNLLRLPHELSLSESFAFVDRQIADERMAVTAPVACGVG